MQLLSTSLSPYYVNIVTSNLGRVHTPAREKKKKIVMKRKATEHAQLNTRSCPTMPKGKRCGVGIGISIIRRNYPTRPDRPEYPDPGLVLIRRQTFTGTGTTTEAQPTQLRHSTPRVVKTKPWNQFQDISRMPPLSALTIYAFGLSALLLGIQNLLSPSSALSSLDLPASALPAVNGTSVAAIAMGIYYCLAAYQRNRAFFALSVPMRMLTASVFWRHGGAWRAAAGWEGGGAVVTAVALLWEAR